MALLRFVEPSQGSITIDGIDITSIGLKDLRSRITLIPQEATLFAGTVRSNLDPMQEHTDEEMLEILERVAMNSKISGSSGTATPISGGEGVDGRKGVTLETLVSAGGLNFSAGQRQLLALARALLKRSNVCILDESTAGKSIPLLLFN